MVYWNWLYQGELMVFNISTSLYRHIDVSVFMSVCTRHIYINIIHIFCSSAR